jgi:hypothetical protein
MRDYYDPKVAFESLGSRHRGLVTNAAGFDAAATRARLLTESHFCSDRVVPFWFRPFDRRWAYIERTANLWNRSRPDLLDQAWPENEFLLVRARAPKLMDGTACYHTRHIGDQHVLHKDAYFIPFRLRPVAKPPTQQPTANTADTMELDLGIESALQPPADAAPSSPVANLSAPAREYLASLGYPDPDANPDVAARVWLHALAIGYSPAYLRDNADGIRHDWPRIPLPNDAGLLDASATLGRHVADLLDPTTQVAGVTSGPTRPFLATTAVVAREGGGSLDAEASEFALTAGWGYESKGGITMPGQGRAVERDYTAAESAALDAEATALGLPAAQVRAQLGETTVDVYLNGVGYWRNVPSRVWQYTLGGFQAMKKWLSYRERGVLGRDLSIEEVMEFSAMARRIAALLLLSPALDASYVATATHVYVWPVSADVADVPEHVTADVTAAGSVATPPSGVGAEDEA